MSGGMLHVHCCHINSKVVVPSICYYLGLSHLPVAHISLHDGSLQHCCLSSSPHDLLQGQALGGKGRARGAGWTLSIFENQHNPAGRPDPTIIIGLLFGITDTGTSSILIH